MRTVLSYLLLFTLALSGFDATVQTAHAYTLADSIVAQQQHTTPGKMPCHSAEQTAPLLLEAVQEMAQEHDCCDMEQHHCKGDCCAKHCAATSALLSTELFRYIRPNNSIVMQAFSLPNWLFAAEPPPPINA